MVQIKRIPFAQGNKKNHLPIEAFLYESDKESKRNHVQFLVNKIVFVIKGRKEIFTETGKIELIQNQGFLLKAGKYLMTERFHKEQSYQSLSINFSGELAIRILSQLKFTNRKNSTNILKINQSPFIDAFIQSLVTYFDSRLHAINYELLLELKLNELFLIILNSQESTAFTAFLQSLHTNNKVSLEMLMESHYRETLSLNELAFLAGMSLSTFKRKFYENMDQTPHQWIQNRRLKEAKRLLKLPDRNVSDVCYETGFENLSHFIQLFRSTYNITPRQFRSEHFKI